MMTPARLALALGSGAAMALSMPPWGWWPLSIVAIVGLDLAIGDPANARQRFVGGWVFGVGWLSMAMGWMWHLSAPGFIVATSFFAAFYGLATLAAPSGRWRLVGRPAALALAEAVRFALPFGGVPLASVAIAQVAGPLGAVARLVGPVGLAWVVFQLGTAIAVGGGLAIAPLRRRTSAPRTLWPVAVMTTAVLLIVITAALAPQGRETGEILRIAAVQGGGEQGTTALEVPTQLVTDRHLAATATIGADDGVDLVVWPENTVRVRDERFADSGLAIILGSESRRLGAPITVGVIEDADLIGVGRPGQVTNAQVVIDADGAIVARYDKVRRVPFGEYVPMRTVLDALGLPIDQVTTDAVAGEDPALLTLPDGSSLGVSISWEVFFSDRAREAIAAGGQVLLNPTNGASYTGTIVQTQQIASSRLRALETGRWVVQTAPTGFSAFISPDGTVLERTAVGERAVIIDDIALRTGSTPYLRWGDRPVVLALIALLVASHLLGRRRARGTASSA